MFIVTDLASLINSFDITVLLTDNLSFVTPNIIRKHDMLGARIEAAMNFKDKSIWQQLEIFTWR